MIKTVQIDLRLGRLKLCLQCTQQLSVLLTLGPNCLSFLLYLLTHKSHLLSFSGVVCESLVASLKFVQRHRYLLAVNFDSESLLLVFLLWLLFVFLRLIF